MAALYHEADGGIQRTYRLTGPVERFHTEKATVEMVPTEEFGVSLFIDNELQFAKQDEYIYHEMLVHPAMITAQEHRRICIIGGGDGLAAREVLKWQDVDQVDIIDWDEELVFLFTTTYSSLNQGSLNEDRVLKETCDIRSLLHETRQYDIIIVDLTDPNHLNGECVNLWDDLLHGIRRWLAPRGSIVMNAGGFYPWDIGTLRWLCMRISSRFREIEGYSIQAYKTFIPSFAREWCYFLICPSANLPIPMHQQIALPRNLRYFDTDTWFLAYIWSKEFDGYIPTKAVNLNQYMPRL